MAFALRNHSSPSKGLCPFPRKRTTSKLIGTSALVTTDHIVQQYTNIMLKVQKLNPTKAMVEGWAFE